MRLFILLAALLALLPLELHAYTLYPVRWPDSCFTHDGTPEVVVSLAAWGQYGNVDDCGTGTEIEVVIDPALSSSGLALLTADQYGVAFHCLISLHPDWAHVQATVNHEVGHCLGLGHSEDETAVMYQYFRPNFTQDDIDGIRAIYGPPRPDTFFRTYLPMVMN